MSKRALIVACSCSGTEMELAGTMSDAGAISQMLQEVYGVDGSDIKYFNEGGQYSEFPTGTAVRTSLKEIATSCAEGDSLLFYFSGNGVRLPAPAGAPPKWGLLVSDLDVLTRDDFNDVLASLPAGCNFTAIVDAGCSHGMLPHPISNGANEKPRMFKAEGGRFVGFNTYINAFNTKYPEAGMQMDNAPQVLLATFPDQPSKYAEQGGEAPAEGEPVAEGLEEDAIRRPRRRWGRYTPPGAVAEGAEEDGDEEDGEEGEGRRSRRERNDEEGDARRRNRRGRRRKNEDGEEEEGEEGEEDEEGEEEEVAEEEPPAEEEAPAAEEEAPAEEEPPAEEEAPPAEEEAPPAEAVAEGFEADVEFPDPVSATDGSVDPEMGTLFAAGMFRSFVSDTAEGGIFTRALVQAVAVGKEANPDGLTNLAVMEGIEATLGEGGFNMTPALVCSEANSAAPFFAAA